MEVPSTKYILSNCLIFSVISTIVIAQIPQRYTLKNPCTSKETCHECIETPSCAWCVDPEYTERPRCFQPSTSEEPNAGCLEQFVLNPDNVMRVLIDEALSNVRTVGGGGGGGVSVGGSISQQSQSHYNETIEWSSKGGTSSGGHSYGRIVQVAPQRISLELRAKQTHTIFMAYKQAQDYPLDLYYLMDLSSSMHDDKDNLSLLGSKLAETMRRLTSNFRLGFGSFVDKVVMPYVSTLAHNLRHPCDGCAPPYGFKNAMRLSPDHIQFSSEVRRANVSGNLDAPEGGFDAIMQSVVCRNHIGWREQARRLLVFSTDASFHYAGDGKLGGIVKPNDGQCHMSRDGIYTESSTQDYPSIEQLNLSIKNNSINVIFAVTKEISAIYKELSRTIEGASCGELKDDSSNVVDLIKEQYEKISSTVKMKHDASNDVNIKFFSSCLNQNGLMEATNQCDGIKVGDTVKFKIDIQIPKCPENPKDHLQTIKIYPVGINESLIIDLKMLCQCDCERPGNKFYEKNSRHCSQQGVYRCGVCECNPGAFGPKCECTAEGDLKNITMNCIDENSTIECSGRGECTCGHCICKPRPNSIERIYGKYCECDNFSCERHNGKICSDHGTCDCGECHCDPGWKDKNCACRNTTDTCKPFGSTDNELCSGHGTCECGVCVCDGTDKERYSGKFCEKCPLCPDRCDEFQKCVQCQQYQTGPLTKEKCASCKTFVPISVKTVTANEEEGEVMCRRVDEDGCRFNYVYFYDEKQVLQVRAQETRECPTEVQIPAIILGVIAAVVLIGMAVLLLWKLLTTIHDRREFAKFEKEKMMAKWDTGENPIYKQATSTFKNPTYSGKG